MLLLATTPCSSANLGLDSLPTWATTPPRPHIHSRRLQPTLLLQYRNYYYRATPRVASRGRRTSATSSAVSSAPTANPTALPSSTSHCPRRCPHWWNPVRPPPTPTAHLYVCAGSSTPTPEANLCAAERNLLQEFSDANPFKRARVDNNKFVWRVHSLINLLLLLSTCCSTMVFLGGGGGRQGGHLEYRISLKTESSFEGAAGWMTSWAYLRRAVCV